MQLEKVIIDSDALVGLQIKQDDHHAAALRGFEVIRTHNLKPVVTNLVIAETTNLLSRRYNTEAAKSFLRHIETLPVITLGIDVHHEVCDLFQLQTRARTSFVDMANVVAMRRFSISQIFAFDKVYEKDFGLRYLPLH